MTISFPSYVFFYLIILLDGFYFNSIDILFFLQILFISFLSFIGQSVFSLFHIFVRRSIFISYFSFINSFRSFRSFDGSFFVSNVSLVRSLFGSFVVCNGSFVRCFVRSYVSLVRSFEHFLFLVEMRIRQIPLSSVHSVAVYFLSCFLPQFPRFLFPKPNLFSYLPVCLWLFSFHFVTVIPLTFESTCHNTQCNCLHVYLRDSRNCPQCHDRHCHRYHRASSLFVWLDKKFEKNVTSSE